MNNRKWLKECKCGAKYWGSNADMSCPECPVTKPSFIARRCACGCGQEFLAESKRNPAYEKKYFDRACQMRARRKTVAGKTYMEEYNKRYKRAEREWECEFPLCGRKFVDARKRVYCDEHSK